MTMVTRYRVEAECGLFLTENGEFSYEIDDAIEFRTEAAAIEESNLHPGTTVERFQRFSTFPDPVIALENARAVA
ncbi:hypothetical protein QO002_002141 [Pararhizobium capsulatum DSM 1112]|uniref:Uncharacterized protein n=1 Tax=Pararhizobium capsulatum DSM 1112 TaxID=1121113 RepID=A0ABU0BPZ3_9HYPH|nr:hypothetical protein [Pararhizobium capsulatum]MDQ0320003.1 hypothetical protein [Pararhizobium capsulatum DSM 1112]